MVAMGLTLTRGSGGSDVPDGLHEAICIGIFDIGHQMTTGPFAGRAHQVVFLWEIQGGTTVSKTYTASLGDKANLRKQLTTWRGRKFSDDELKGFSLRNVVGARCQIQVINNDKGWPQIETITPCGRDHQWEAHNQRLFFEIGDTIPDGTPNWIINRIKSSEELSGIPAGETQSHPSDPEPQHQETQQHPSDDHVPF